MDMQDLIDGPASTGRPSSFRPEFAAQAAKLCALGATDADLADFFDVSVRTIHRWKHEHEAFCHAIKVAKEIADDRVERSLYQRAIGYEHDEVDIRTVALGGNAGSEIVQTPIRKHYPPDTVAAIFWLKNRQSARWRDIKAVELSGHGGGAVRVEQITRTIVDPKAAK